MVAILINAAFIGVALISMWIPKSAALIRGRPFFEAQSLLEEIRHFLKSVVVVCLVLYSMWKPV